MKIILNNKIFRYILVGGFSYFIELCVIVICKYAFGISDVYSVAISFWIGLVVAFVLQKLITFKEKSKGKKVVKQSVLYILLVLFNYIFTLAFVGLLSSITYVVIARTIALIITTSWNFLLYNKYLFKSEGISV